MSNSVRIVVDDTNSTLHYHGNWFTAGNGSMEYNGTTHGTRTPGSIMTFTFNGTFVSVFGTVGVTDSSSSYMLDNQPVFEYTAPQPASPLYQQRFYQSPLLSDGQHTLAVQKATQDDSYLWLDFLEYNATITPPASSHEKAARAGSIAAAVIGAIACVGTALLLFRLARRRRQDRPAGPRPDLLGTAEKALPLENSLPTDGLYNGVPIIRQPRPPKRAARIVSISPLSLSAPTAPSVPPKPHVMEIGLVPGLRAPSPLRPHRTGRFVVTNGAASPSVTSDSGSALTSPPHLPHTYGGAECPSYEVSQSNDGSVLLARGPSPQGVNMKS